MKEMKPLKPGEEGLLDRWQREEANKRSIMSQAKSAYKRGEMGEKPKRSHLPQEVFVPYPVSANASIYDVCGVVILIDGRLI